MVSHMRPISGTMIRTLWRLKNLGFFGEYSSTWSVEVHSSTLASTYLSQGQRVTALQLLVNQSHALL